MHGAEHSGDNWVVWSALDAPIIGSGQIMRDRPIRAVSGLGMTLHFGLQLGV